MNKPSVVIRNMKKFVSTVLCLSIALSLAGCTYKTIGRIEGAEWDRINIGETEYVKATNFGVSNAD
jgi:hypothetical protein